MIFIIELALNKSFSREYCLIIFFKPRFICTRRSTGTNVFIYYFVPEVLRQRNILAQKQMLSIDKTLEAS